MVGMARGLDRRTDGQSHGQSGGLIHFGLQRQFSEINGLIEATTPRNTKQSLILRPSRLCRRRCSRASPPSHRSPPSFCFLSFLFSPPKPNDANFVIDPPPPGLPTARPWPAPALAAVERGAWPAGAPWRCLQPVAAAAGLPGAHTYLYSRGN